MLILLIVRNLQLVIARDHSKASQEQVNKCQRQTYIKPLAPGNGKTEPNEQRNAVEVHDVRQSPQILPRCVALHVVHMQDVEHAHYMVGYLEQEWPPELKSADHGAQSEHPNAKVDQEHHLVGNLIRT